MNNETASRLFKIGKTADKVLVWYGYTEGSTVVTVSGQDGGTMTSSTTVAEGNSRMGPKEHAEFQLTALYKAQQENKHYRDSLEGARAVKDNNTIPRKLHNMNKNAHQMTYPCWLSPKMNGSRACIVGGNLYSKAGRMEEVKVKRIESAIHRMTEMFGAKYNNIDAEVYLHGISLQRIRSAWTKPDKSTKDIKKCIERLGYDYDPLRDSANLKLHVFDIPVVGVPYEDRMILMKSLEAELMARDKWILDKFEAAMSHQGGLPYPELFSDVIEFVHPVLVGSYEEAMVIENDWVKNGHLEGSVFNKIGANYVFGDTKTTSSMKSKPRQDAEAFVYDVVKDKKGNGKALCRHTNPEGNSVEFTCVMKVDRPDGKTYSKAYEIAREELIGKWITFSYEEYSEKGIPTKQVGENLRKCDANGNAEE